MKPWVNLRKYKKLWMEEEKKDQVERGNEAELMKACYSYSITRLINLSCVCSMIAQ